VNPAISVICPAWQAAETLAETLASVRAQLLPPAEIIVVDDGSTDESSTIAVSAGASVLRIPHRGAAAALNAGIAASGSDLLAFVDADDLWPLEKLQIQTRILATDITLAGVLGRVRSFISPEIEPNVARRFRLPESPQPAWLIGALLVRRELVKSVGAFDEEMHAGYTIDWFDRARRLGFSFAIPDNVVLLRRVRSDSLSHRSKATIAGYALMAKRAVQRRRDSVRVGCVGRAQDT
jgi:glycosyltransferase involved in cell wall biosynthesis